MDQNEFSKINQEYLKEFINSQNHSTDKISHSVIATITEFVAGIKRKFTEIADKNDGYVDSVQLLDVQIDQMRQCILDLEHCKEILIKGVNLQ